MKRSWMLCMQVVAKRSEYANLFLRVSAQLLLPSRWTRTSTCQSTVAVHVRTQYLRSASILRLARCGCTTSVYVSYAIRIGTLTYQCS